MIAIFFPAQSLLFHFFNSPTLLGLLPNLHCPHHIFTSQFTQNCFVFHFYSNSLVPLKPLASLFISENIPKKTTTLIRSNIPHTSHLYPNNQIILEKTHKLINLSNFKYLTTILSESSAASAELTNPT